MAGAKEAGIEEGRNNNVGKNETQNRVSEIGSVNFHLETRSVNLTEISGIKAGNVLCRNLISKYYMSSVVELGPVNNYLWNSIGNIQILKFYVKI